MDIIRKRSIVLILFLVYLFSTQNHFMFSLGMICKPSERRALLSFKQHLKDPYNRNSLSSWSVENCCRWAGVVCSNRTDHVVQLQLHDLWLSGELNPSLQELKQLRHLDLSLNAFDGICIPDFLGSLQSLRYLNLSSAGFGGMIPHQLGNLSNLRYLDLSSDYRFTSSERQHAVTAVYELNVAGNFQWISHFSSLKHLDLSGVNLENASDIQWISHLSSLKHLDLSGVNLENASDFQWISHLSSLKHLDLSGVNLENASDFQWISHLSNLEHLDLSLVNLENASSNWFHVVNMLPSLLALRLSDCSLSSGALPTTSLSHVNFTSLQVLDLSGNNFNSALLPEWLYSLTNLRQLDLSDNFFQGTISPSIGNLTKLKLLSLNSNGFQGTIPASVGNLTKLTLFDLSDNPDLEGKIPTTIGNLCNLRRLDLSNNKLTGEISGFLESSTRCITSSSLRTLYLSYNQLSGPLPDEQLGRLQNLEYLSLRSNSFSGSIPISIGRLTLLTDLDLSRNQLNGHVPESFGNLSKLETLFLSYNSLEGNVSQGLLSNLTSLQDIELHSVVLKVSPEWIPPFQLTSAYLRNCGLGPRFPNWIQTQKLLEDLDLSSNGISGTVPTWFWNLSSQFSNLNLSHNHFNEELPKVLLYSSSIDLNSNRFKGPLPRLASRVSELDLSNNSFSGHISALVCNPSIEVNNLQILDLSNNLLSGDLSQCWFYWTSLILLKVGSNNITGKIPSSMGSLLDLHSLHLQNNNLSGDLPLSLRNCTSLNMIDIGENVLTGRLPKWLGESFPELIVLRLRLNMFHGEIPQQLCDMMTSLQILDLAHNNLSGSIPRCFNNFAAMATRQNSSTSQGRFVETTSLVMKGREYEYSITLTLVTNMDLSKNSLSGEIPKELASLIGLRFLNLSHNHFTGKIPEKIGNMRLLESLDFSNNNISGVIPQSISGISSLSYLNLSYNNLSGKIPSSTQLQSFNESSFIGNQDLCGLPLKNCNPPQKPGDIGDRADEDEDWFEMKWFYMSMGVGFAVGFWTFWGVMVLKRSWRIACFRFFDDMKDKICLLF